jgi:hypothetical protein
MWILFTGGLIYLLSYGYIRKGIADIEPFSVRRGHLCAPGQ